jgi:SAM-dependent methyltransferase
VEISGREFEAVAAHAGLAYLRYSFTKGTEQEVRFLTEEVGVEAGMRVLDVGCGPGRHSAALNRMGVECVGLDISFDFLTAAGPGRWVRGDARRLPFTSHAFDAAICLCQGGFGLMGGTEDGLVLEEMARVVRGKVVLSAFSAYFAVRFQEEGDIFDAGSGVNHEVTTVMDPAGKGKTFDLWTTCFTPRELRLMSAAAGLKVAGLWSVGPGDYAKRDPDVDHPEFLLIGEV